MMTHPLLPKLRVNLRVIMYQQFTANMYQRFTPNMCQ